MIEISGDHVSKLNDKDLRALVVQLCEAELRQFGLPISSVIAGGNQNSSDGGIDVRVELPIGIVTLDFIPRSTTGFQVKCSNMPSGAVKSEMRPKGQLRASICNLASVLGAYVIVSSKGSVSDTSLQKRKRAMCVAVEDLSNRADLHIDFYDRVRLASWVRKYPGVSLWLREQIGEPISGWRGYGNWAFGDKPNSEYLLDDAGRIVSKESGSHEPMAVEQGIAAIRKILAIPGGIVRLIGLSGLGKTRLVQALFDAKVGQHALDSSLVAYTDQGLEPVPSPRDMLFRLQASGVRTIVVVDNCNPSTHRALAQMVGKSESTVSLITVEYDVADDEPEDTQVFQLEPASEKVLLGILERLTPHVSHADRNTIVNFSGGNPRIALALARRVKHHEGLGILNETELFKRLFFQHQDVNINLMRSAEVLSLVYSFDGETLEGDGAELPLLAGLAELSIKELFRSVGELRSRDLVQKRGKWRAMLPHAIANRLARQALERIPPSLIIEVFEGVGRERLLKSFGRRLGYLHSFEPAISIATKWLSDPNWLANPEDGSELKRSLFFNLAPIVPEQALKVIESKLSGQNGETILASDYFHRHRWGSLLRSLAFDPEFFDRAAYLLARFVASEPESSRNNSSLDNFVELFHIYLSGTHALIGQRIGLIKKLLHDSNQKLGSLGLHAMGAILRINHFSSSHDFTFGARSRDFGWEPKSQSEITEWYQMGINLVAEFTFGESSIQKCARDMILQNFGMLWGHAGIDDELERVARKIAAPDGWPEGWVSVKRTIKYHAGKMPAELVARLRALEVDLRPRDLAEKVRAYVLPHVHGGFDLADAEAKDDSGEAIEESFKSMQKYVEAIGKEVAKSPEIFKEIIAETLRIGQGRQDAFGRGLAANALDIRVMWIQICDALSLINESERNIAVLRGYIAGAFEREPEVVNLMLDEAIVDPLLGPSFPILQAGVRIDDRGAARIVQSLANRLAPAWTYRYLSYGRASDDMLSSNFKKIVLGIAELPDGFSTAVNVLDMRLHILKSEQIEIDQDILTLGQTLLANCDFRNRDDNIVYHLSEVAKVCLLGANSVEATKTFCKRFAKSLADYKTEAWRFGDLAKTLFQIHPKIALDIFLREFESKDYSLHSRLILIREEASPVNEVPDELLRVWAEEDPGSRFVLLAREIRLFSDKPEKLSWTSLALYLIEKAPNRQAVLAEFSTRLRPRSWSGSLADVLTPYLAVVHKLSNHDDPVVREWVVRQEELLSSRIERERQQERNVDESFE